MNEVEDAILGFHIFIVGLLFLAASILTLCGIAALVRLVSLLLSAYSCQLIGRKLVLNIPSAGNKTSPG